LKTSLEFRGYFFVQNGYTANDVLRNRRIKIGLNLDSKR